MITREEWLKHAVELIDAQIFEGALDLEVHHDYQIACGWTKRPTKALGETIFPYDGEDVQLDDFFPVTIHINCMIKEPQKMIITLIHECIHAFFNIHGHGKEFGHKAKEVGFEKPYTQYNPSQYLMDQAQSIYLQLKEKYGDFPGKPIVLHPKEKKTQKNTFTLFCPSCGYELKISRKMFEKYHGACPTCVCGAKMAKDCSDEEPGDEENEESKH